MSSIYILRHGQSVGNANSTLYDTMFNPEMPLNTTGEDESRMAAKLLEDDIRSTDDWSMAIFSSHYLRAVQTAEIIGQTLGRKTKQSVFLAERHFGEEEGGTDVDDFSARPMERHAYDKAGHLAYAPVRGESLLDVHMRVFSIYTLHNRESCLHLSHASCVLYRRNADHRE